MLEKLRRDKERVKRKRNLKQLPSILRNIGDHLTEEGKYKEALSEYKELLTVCEELNDRLNTAIAHRMIGETLTSLGKYTESLSHHKQYLKIAKEMHDLIEQQRAHATLGRTYFCLSESIPENELEKKSRALEDAQNSYKKSLILCQKLNNDKTIKSTEIMMMTSRLFLNLGLVYDAKKEHEQAIEIIERAAKLCEQQNFTEDHYRSLISLGGIYERMNNETLAQSHYEQAAKINDPGLNALARLTCVEFYIKIGKFKEARELLVKLYVHHTDETIVLSAKKYLRILAVIDLGERDLSTEIDNDKRLEIYEKMGDAAVAGQSYKKAIDYYRAMLACAKFSKSENKMSAALVSLAQTLKDNDQYDEALIYARQELELCKDPREISRSALFLAELLLNTNSPSEEIIETLELALENAVKSEKPALKLDVLKEMKYYYSKLDKEQTIILDQEKIEIIDYKEKIKTIDEEIDNIGDAFSVTSSNEGDQDEVGLDIDLSDLSDIEEEILKRDGDKVKSSRQSKRSGYQVRRNLKGETHLHTACIEGNIKKVNELLDAKHPINVRDNCGWTPLHEASNHGFVEIVKLLLERGANVNDPGGLECGGVTPLHDAAACGHTVLINLLMEYGADPRLKTAKDETVLDCLEAWRERVSNLSAADDSEYQKICEKLRKLLPPKLKQKVSNDTCVNATPRFFSPLVDSEDPDDRPMITDDIVLDEERVSAREVYKRTMENIRHPLRVNKKLSTSPKKIAAPLIDSEEVLVDEWLEDDIGPQPSTSSSLSCSKKRRSNNTGGGDTPGSAKRRTNNFSPNGDKIIKRPRTNEYVSSDVTFIDSEDSQSSEISEDLFSSTAAKLQKKKPRQVSLLTNGFTRNLSSRSPSPIFINSGHNNSGKKDQSSDSIKIKIKVDDRIYNLKLRPSEKNSTLIGNIENDVARKFEEDTGCTGKFTFTTTSGDTLTVDNILNVIYSSDDGLVELDGKISDLKIPLLTDRYKRISNIEIIPEAMLKSLKTCEKTSTFRLREAENTENELICLLKSLVYEKNLQVLHLSGGGLFNIGDIFSETILQLSSLQELHLQCCDIEVNFLNYIHQLPGQLRVLNLSYNPLGPESQNKLVELIRPLRNLQTLNLCYCQLDKFPANAVNSSIINLDLSHNSLDDDSIDGYLQKQMINLNLSNIYWPDKTIGTLILSSINDVVFVSLDVLELSGCNLTNFDVKNIVDKCKNLSKINVSGNKSISGDGVGALLAKKPTLSMIDASGCAIINENPRDDVVIDKVQVCLLTASMSLDVVDYWENLWLGQASLIKLAHSVFIFKPSL